jgi:hypothetical protein
MQDILALRQAWIQEAGNESIHVCSSREMCKKSDEQVFKAGSDQRSVRAQMVERASSIGLVMARHTPLASRYSYQTSSLWAALLVVLDRRGLTTSHMSVPFQADAFLSRFHSYDLATTVIHAREAKTRLCAIRTMSTIPQNLPHFNTH